MQPQPISFVWVYIGVLLIVLVLGIIARILEWFRENIDREWKGRTFIIEGFEEEDEQNG